MKSRCTPLERASGSRSCFPQLHRRKSLQQRESPTTLYRWLRYIHPDPPLASPSLSRRVVGLRPTAPGTLVFIISHYLLCMIMTLRLLSPGAGQLLARERGIILIRRKRAGVCGKAAIRHALLLSARLLLNI